ncbi:MAG: TolC family protein, partial [Pseudomonadota bacterium]|nr:TolC family protein [Pseudomonadota bacterium]
MKKSLIGLLLLCTTPAFAELDPFSVYSVKAPEGCVDAPLKKGEFTLPELIQIGICNNPTLSRSYMSVKASEANLGQAKSAYLPDITATGSIQQHNQKVEDQSTTKAYPYSGNLALSWLVYDFGGRSAKTDQMKAYLDAAEFSYNATLHDTVLAINQAYFDLLSAQEVLKSTQESEKTFKKSYEESSKRFDLGLVSSSDKLLAKTTYENSRLDVVQADNTLKKAKGALAVLLNLSPDTELKVTTPPKNKDITKLEGNETVQELMEIALTLRPELKSQQSQMTAAEREIKILEAADFPTISAGASVGYGDNWKKHSPYAVDSSVGLSLSLPLFTGFSDTYKTAHAKYQYRQAALSVLETQDSVRKDVWNSYQDYKTAVEAYKI